MVIFNSYVKLPEGNGYSKDVIIYIYMKYSEWQCQGQDDIWWYEIYNQVAPETSEFIWYHWDITWDTSPT